MLFSRFTLPQLIALSAALLSLITITMTFTIWSLRPGVESCIPFFTGCTSITNTGLRLPEAFIFRAGMISCGVVMVIWWFSMQRFLVHYKENYWGFWLRSMFLVSMLVSALIIISVTVMGPEMNDSKFLVQLHTTTAVLFFLFTTINQSVLTWWLTRSVKNHNLILKTLTAKRIINAAQILCLTILIIDQFDWAPDFGNHLTNAIEWWLALLSSLYFLTAYWDWDDFGLIEQED